VFAEEETVAICPFARWMPVTSRTLEPFKESPRGLVLHISNSRGNTLEGLRSTFMGSNKYPSHFGVDRSGKIAQFLDTAYHDWAEEHTIAYFSVENSASPGDRLSGEQIQAVARIYGWLSLTHGIAVKTAISAGDTGLAYHSLFPPTDHMFCPGPAVVGQRHKIIEATKFLFLPV
jgi:hypothetical protein